jgi:hypothetical protein
MAERYQQIHGGKDIREKTIDETRLISSGVPEGWVLKVQADGSLAFQPVMDYDGDLRVYLFEG